MSHIQTDGLIDYELLVHSALRRVIKNVMEQVASAELPGEHHFYICFVTTHPLVQLPDYLYQEYPEDMTIVLQHEYWDLEVTDLGFSVTLCFDENHERLYIPFDAVISFVDPSVKFGLQFNPVYPENMIDEKEPILSLDKRIEEGSDESENNVVTIDFSKRK